VGLNNIANPENALKFTIGDSDEACLAAGVTFADFASAALQVYALLRYEDDPWVGPWPHLRVESTPQTEGMLSSYDPGRQSRCDYAMIRHQEEDANGQTPSDYENITVAVN